MKEKKFIKLTPFKMQVLQSFPFIDADFDAITNYELLCKVVEYLNTTVDNVNLLESDFKILYDYVHDYFDNLDVQEEINNKLDEMAESGQLADIIAQYLGLAGMLVFNTVNDMKQATNLVNGSTCQTLGFYSINDGGKAIYKIRNITEDDIINNMNIISLNNENLIAELIVKNSINVKQVGAIENGVTDDTRYIQKAIDLCDTVIFNNKSYLLKTNRNDCLKLRDNLHLIGNNTILKGINENLSISNILYTDNANNLQIENFILYGDVNENVNQDEGAGHGIYINSNNIILNNIKCYDCFTDGIYIRGNNITIKNTLCEHNGRQGISITNGENILLENVECNTSFRINPKSGIDIEPSLNTDIIDNIILNNIKTNNNAETGLNISLLHLLTDKECNIIVNNFIDNGSNSGIQIGQHTPTNNIKGTILLTNINLINTKTQPLGIRPRDKDKSPNLIIDNLNIINPNTSQNATSYASGIYIYGGSENVHTGNIKLNNINYKNTENMFRPIYINGEYYENIYVNDCDGIEDMLANVKYNNIPNSIYNINDNAAYNTTRLINIINTSFNTTITFRKPVGQKGKEFLFIHNSNATLTYDFKFPIQGLSTSGKVSCGTKGASLKLMDINNEYYIIISSSGTWTDAS